MKFISILLAITFGLVMAGCGGGGGGGTQPPPIDDTTAPTIQSYSAVYSDVTGNATISATITDASGIKTVQAFVNGGSIATNMYLSSTNRYTGFYEGVPENMTDANITYSVTIYATDTKGNVGSVTTTFSVPPFGPPPPPVLP